MGQKKNPKAVTVMVEYAGGVRVSLADNSYLDIRPDDRGGVIIHAGGPMGFGLAAFPLYGNEIRVETRNNAD